MLIMLSKDDAKIQKKYKYGSYMGVIWELYGSCIEILLPPPLWGGVGGGVPPLGGVGGGQRAGGAREVELRGASLRVGYIYKSKKPRLFTFVNVA